MGEPTYKPDPVLLFTATMLKSHARQIFELSSSIAALSLSVKGLDPTFDDVREEKKKEVEKMLAPKRQKILDQYDLLLEAIQSGYFSRL